MNIIYCYNQCHLGDHMFSYILFYNIKEYIEENNIIISYFAKPEYHVQIREFIPSKNIILNEHYEEKGFNLWIGNRNVKHNWWNTLCHRPYSIPFNIFLSIFFNECLQIFKIPYQLGSFKYTDPDIMVRYHNLKEQYKNIDILVINSSPLSSQYNYNKYAWDLYINVLNKNFNIVTTLKVDGVKCTLDDGLTIKDIAGLSTHVKVIIAINTGPVVPLLNTYTLSNVKKWYTFDIKTHYTYEEYPNLFERKDYINDININDLNKYIK